MPVLGPSLQELAGHAHQARAAGATAAAAHLGLHKHLKRLLCRAGHGVLLRGTWLGVALCALLVYRAMLAGEESIFGSQ